MFASLTRIAALAIALLCVQAACQGADADNPSGKKFYITAPACDYYQCHVTKHAPGKMLINWLNPLPGLVDIKFVPEKSNGPTYTIAHKLSAHNNEASCNKGSEKSCGSYTWKIPQSVKSGDYSVEIHSLHDKTVYGYTDIITISKKQA